MARASPVVPEGYTAIEVRLASSADNLSLGDIVTLSSATIFGEATPETSPDTDAVTLRELCSGAILTAKPSRDADGNTLAVFAMPPHEAATVLQAQEYSAIIAIIGCHQGFLVSGNAESVGQRTTMAVVQAIFVVIVLDAVFAVFYSALGFN